MKLVYVDTNSWMRLVEATPSWDAEAVFALNRVVDQASRCGDIGLVLGSPVLDELCRLHSGNAALYRKVLKAAKRLAGNRILSSVKRVSALELRQGRGLWERERYLTRTQRLKQFWPAMTNARYLAEAPNRVATRVREFQREETHRRAAWTGYCDEAREWWKEKDERIDSWVSDHIQRTEAAVWPALGPRGLPATRAFFSYKLARIYMNVGESRRVEQGDYYDAEHFALAAYTDILLTDDHRMVETATAIGDSLPLVCLLSEFQQLLESS